MEANEIDRAEQTLADVVVPTEPPTMSFALHWAAGTPIPGVSFARASHVRILGGAFAHECGSVRDLVCVDPEPCYRVEVDAAHVTLEIAQSALDGI